MTNTSSQRLASLDILRGFDLFMLLFLQPVFVAVDNVYDAPWLHSLMRQFDHEVWEGFRCWDLVMPLFLFMAGAAMPFSLSKHQMTGQHGRKVCKRIGRRFLLLFVFGMIVQGNLLGFDPQRLYIYNNTLQAIAFGYLIAAVILLNFRPRMQCVLTLLLLVVYSIPMAIKGDWTPEDNFAFAVDRAVIGRFRGDLTYTWVWSSLTFGATVMFGALAGELMRNRGRMPRQRIAAWLAAGGLVLVALGLALSMFEPIIKRLWTSSMTLFASGLCCLLMALAYWWIDVRGYSRGLGWLKVYGMNPITAYVLGEVINFRSIVGSVSYGLQPHLGQWYSVWLTFGNFVILFLLLLVMYRQRVFLKF